MTDMVKTTELEDELNLSPGSVRYWVNKLDIYTEKKGCSHYLSVADAQKIRDERLKPKERKEHEHVKAVSTQANKQNDNRNAGKYHRITPLWMIDAHQGEKR